jgi:hypothetical protein
LESKEHFQIFRVIVRRTGEVIFLELKQRIVAGQFRHAPLGVSALIKFMAVFFRIGRRAVEKAATLTFHKRRYQSFSITNLTLITTATGASGLIMLEPFT